MGTIMSQPMADRGYTASLPGISSLLGILILLFSFLTSRIVASERVPQDLSETVQGIATPPIAAILLTDLSLALPRLFGLL